MRPIADVIREIEKRLEATAHTIVSGSCADYAQYRGAVGRLKALDEVLEYIRRGDGEKDAQS